MKNTARRTNPIRVRSNRNSNMLPDIESPDLATLNARYNANFEFPELIFPPSYANAINENTDRVLMIQDEEETKDGNNQVPSDDEEEDEQPDNEDESIPQARRPRNRYATPRMSLETPASRTYREQNITALRRSEEKYAEQERRRANYVPIQICQCHPPEEAPNSPEQSGDDTESLNQNSEGQAQQATEEPVNIVIPDNANPPEQDHRGVIRRNSNIQAAEAAEAPPIRKRRRVQVRVEVPNDDDEYLVNVVISKSSSSSNMPNQSN